MEQRTARSAAGDRGGGCGAAATFPVGAARASSGDLPLLLRGGGCEASASQSGCALDIAVESEGDGCCQSERPPPRAPPAPRVRSAHLRGARSPRRLFNTRLDDIKKARAFGDEEHHGDAQPPVASGLPDRSVWTHGSSSTSARKRTRLRPFRSRWSKTASVADANEMFECSARQKQRLHSASFHNASPSNPLDGQLRRGPPCRCSGRKQAHEAYQCSASASASSPSLMKVSKKVDCAAYSSIHFRRWTAHGRIIIGDSSSWWRGGRSR